MRKSTVKTARRLLGVPVFYKIIVANVAITALVVCALVGLRVHAAPSQAWLVAGAVCLILGSGAINALLVRAALRPLDQLSETVARVTAGDFSVRVPASDLADAKLEQLRLAYNGMLDTVENARSRQRELLAWTLDSTEKERDRVANDLNDRLAQRLTAAMFLAGARNVPESVAQLRAEMAAVVHDLCATAESLQPPAMRLLGLRGALDWYARSLEKRAAIKMQLVLDGTMDHISQNVLLAVYRAIEDAMETLACRPGSRAHVHVKARDLALEATVSIFGEPHGSLLQLTASEHFRMTERAACVGGSLKVDDTEGQTAVCLTIPIYQGATDAGYDTSIAC